MSYLKLIPDFIIKGLCQELKKEMTLVKKVDGKYFEIDGFIMFKRKDKNGNFQLYDCPVGGCAHCPDENNPRCP